MDMQDDGCAELTATELLQLTNRSLLAIGAPDGEVTPIPTATLRKAGSLLLLLRATLEDAGHKLRLVQPAEERDEAVGQYQELRRMLTSVYVDIDKATRASHATR